MMRLGGRLRAVAGIFGLCGLLAAPAALAADAPAPADFAIVHVRVFDGERVTPDATVVVVGQGRVASVGRKAPPAGVTVVDGAGKTLLPGLIDSHTHIVSGRTDALRFGVVTELDMFGAAAMLPTLARERAATGPTPQADVFSAGTLATAPRGHGTEYGLPIPTLTAPDQADKWVADRVAEGSDYIKVVYQPFPPGRGSPSIDRATLDALVKAAHARGKLVVVHVQTNSAAAEALDAGVDGLAHIYSDAPADPAFFKTAKAKRMFVIPTLSVIGGIGDPAPARALMADARIGPYLTPVQRGELARNFGAKQKAFDLDVSLAAVRALHAAGVDILAGTDAGNPAITHGASLHQELALLVRAGLTPTEALAAATSVPARRFKLEGRGRIAVGVRADLVLVDGDPTRDIEASRAIAAIWKNGYPVARPTFAVQAAAAPVAARPLMGLLGGFEADLAGPEGLAWDRSSDVIAGGKSESAIVRITPGVGGGQGALRLAGEVRPGGFTTWAGAQLPFSPMFDSPRDLSGAKALVFSVRGNVPGGVVMTTSNLRAAWPTQAFAITQQWTEVRLPLAGFTGLDPKRVLALVISAAPTAGRFQIDIDQVRLE